MSHLVGITEKEVNLPGQELIPTDCYSVEAGLADLRQRLSHVLWIGGSTCAGKSSVADVIASKYGLAVYHYDRREPDHTARRSMSPGKFPALTSFLSMSMDERWVLRSPDAMAQNVVASWTERFPLVIEDLLVMPGDSRILAEGPGLFPQLVFPLLSSLYQAIWLIASKEVIQAVRIRRPSVIRRETSDPDRAVENIINRDMHLAKYNRQQAAELGLAAYEVDWSKPIDEVATIVENHFSPLLSDAG